MESLIIKAKSRSIFGKKNKYLRRQNKIPSVIYGHGRKSQPIEINYLLFQKIYEKAGASTLIDLQIDDKEPVKVLIQDLQFSPLEDRYIHVDFYQVKMTEKITAEIPLKFIGETPAIKELGGIPVKNLDKIKIECLPDKLIHEVEVDISQIKTFEESIHVQDLNIPEGITVMDKPDEAVFLVEAPRSEEELKSLEETPAAAEEAKVEGAEAAEGEEVPTEETDDTSQESSQKEQEK